MAVNNRQAAVRFHTPATGGRFLRLPGVLPVLKALASRFPFLAYEQIAVLPKEILPGGAYFYPLCAGICGSDKSLVKLNKGLFAFSDVPVAPDEADLFLRAQRLLGLHSSQGRVLRSFTLGHEIAALDEEGRLGVLYPIFSCLTRFEPPDYCESCRNGLENLCLKIHEGPVQGLALGVGAQSAAGLALGGGMQEVIIAHPSQFLPVEGEWVKSRPLDEVVKTLVMVDAYACAINGVEMVIDDAADRDLPVFLVGLGAIGFSVLDYLRQRGFKRLFVLAKHPEQLRRVQEYGYTALPLGSGDSLRAAAAGAAARLEEMGHGRWLRGGYPVVFDCVGSRRSLIDACLLTQEGGHLVELGLPEPADFDWYLPGRKQIHLHFPFWATRRQFLAALEHLQNISATCRQIVNCDYSLQEGKRSLRAFFPGWGGQHIKSALRIRPFEEGLPRRRG